MGDNNYMRDNIGNRILTIHAFRKLNAIVTEKKPYDFKQESFQNNWLRITLRTDKEEYHCLVPGTDNMEGLFDAGCKLNVYPDMGGSLFESVIINSYRKIYVSPENTLPVLECILLAEAPLGE